MHRSYTQEGLEMVTRSPPSVLCTDLQIDRCQAVRIIFLVDFIERIGAEHPFGFQHLINSQVFCLLPHSAIPGFNSLVQKFCTN